MIWGAYAKARETDGSAGRHCFRDEAIWAAIACGEVDVFAASHVICLSVCWVIVVSEAV